MKKRRVVILLCFMAILSGCSKEKEITNRENETVTQGDISAENGEERTEYSLTSWQSLECYANEEDSIRNSNKLNFGKLWAGSDGRIYYIDEKNKTVVASDLQGEETEVLYEGEVVDLQESEGFIYLHLNTGLIRLNCITGEIQQLWQEPFGEFLIVQDRLYLNGAKGFCKMNLDGTDLEILLPDPETSLWMPCGDYWICNEVSGIDPLFFWEGHLLLYSETTDTLTQLGEHWNYPLLAGNLIVAFSSETKSTHVWNLETGEDIDLLTYALKPVSDGKNLYYFAERGSEEGNQVMLVDWNGVEEVTLAAIEGVTIDVLYIAHRYLYWQIEGENDYEWWYYGLETGKIGKLCS